MIECISCNKLKSEDEFSNIKRRGVIYKRKKCKDCVREYFRVYNQKNKEKLKVKIKEYRQKNKHKIRIWSSFRRARKLKATPTWLTDERKATINKIYKKAHTLSKQTNVKYEVDRIIPLKPKLVCGLHVLWNLQVLTKTQNRLKSNYFGGENNGI